MRYVFSLTGDAIKNKLDEQAMRYLYSHTGDGLNLKLFIKMTVRRTGYAIPPFTHRRRKEAIDASHTQARRKTTEFLNDLRTESSAAPVECRTKPARTERTASGLMWAISINIAKTILACALLHQQSVRPTISAITVANSATGTGSPSFVIAIGPNIIARPSDVQSLAVKAACRSATSVQVGL